MTDKKQDSWRVLYNFFGGGKEKKGGYRCLFASAVGEYGKKYLAKIIQKFGTEDFDYTIFKYDDTRFDEQVFKDCKFIEKKSDYYIEYQCAK
ncbi:MAG: hypothetical protein ABIH11_06245, partial [Candidatus Altiarchaeota archaeon]